MALISASQFREHYPQLSGTGEDTLLDKLIARADQLMAAFCAHPLTDGNIHTLEAATYTRYLRPRHDDDRVIDLPHPLATAITTAHVDENWAYGASTLIPSTDYVLDTARRELWRKPTATGLPWSRSKRANKIVFVAGIVAAAAAPEFVAIAAFAARHLLDLDHTLGLQSATDAGHSATYGDASALLPAAVKEHLGPWVNWAGRVG